MTDDEILAAAERIKARRLKQREIDSFRAAETVMIRWDVSHQQFGFSYASISVPREMMENLVCSFLAIEQENVGKPMTLREKAEAIGYKFEDTE